MVNMRNDTEVPDVLHGCKDSTFSGRLLIRKIINLIGQDGIQSMNVSFEAVHTVIFIQKNEIDLLIQCLDEVLAR